jgi:hypothetical protein
MNEKPLDLAEFLRLMIGAFESTGIEYMIGGAIASWVWGEPRATQDLDIVVDIPFEAVSGLSNELKARDVKVTPEIIMDALIENRADIPIHAIHIGCGLKADLYPIRSGDELRQEAFQRRLAIDFGPPIGIVFGHSPEDLIIYKLLHFGLSQQTKHIRDISAILLAKKNQLDLAYIEKWVNRLGLATLWFSLLGNFEWVELSNTG